MSSLSQEEAFARIRLLRSPNIGPISYRQLIARFGTAAAALDELPACAAYQPPAAAGTLCCGMAG